MEASDASNAGEILIDSEENRAMIHGNRCNQGVDSGQRESSRAAKTENGGRFAIGGKVRAGAAGDEYGSGFGEGGSRVRGLRVAR